MSMVEMKINRKNIFVFILDYLDNGTFWHMINKPCGLFCMSEDARMPVPPGSGGTRLPGGHAEAVDSDIRFKFKRDRNVK